LAIELELTKAQEALIISTTEVRPILDNLCVRDKELIAADGFMLISTPIKAEGEFLIPAAAIRKVRSEELAVQIDGKKVTVSASCESTDAKYPDLSYLTKFKTPPKGYVALNAAYLSRLCELAGKTPSGIITLYIRDAPQPVEFVIGIAGTANSYHGLIMPMFISPDESKLYPVVP